MSTSVPLWHTFDVFFFKQKTAYEMRISDWSSDVCSSDLAAEACPMRKQHRDRHAALALCREGGPMVGDEIVIGHEAPVGEDREADRPDTLGRRPEIDDRIRLPRARARGIAPAALKVDHHPVADDQAKRRAELGRAHV